MATEVKELAAARELDALVAERVMGLTVSQWGDVMVVSSSVERLAAGDAVPARNYSTSMAAAMEVINKMSTTTKEYWTLEIFSTGAVATFRYEGGRDLPWIVGEHQADAAELAEAVCRAPLTAVTGESK